MFSIFQGDPEDWMPNMPERPSWWTLMLGDVLDFLTVLRMAVGESAMYLAPGLLLGTLYSYYVNGSYLLCGSIGAFVSLFLIVGSETLVKWLHKRAIHTKEK